MNEYPSRHSVRLNGYDYRESGAYFVTICTHQRACLFGAAGADTVVLSEYGQIAQGEWEQIPNFRPNVQLDAFVVMPNHIHGIIVIMSTGDDGGLVPADTKNRVPTKDGSRQFGRPITDLLSTIVGSYKAGVSRKINRLSAGHSTFAWQHNYYEHIIRNEADLNRIRLYVETNPAKWAEDSLYAE